MNALTRVPLICQRDWRWKNKKLGLSSETIGDCGSALACLAMLGAASQHAESIPLDTLNDTLRQIGGFYNFSFVRWSHASALFPHLHYDGRIDIGSTPADRRDLRAITDRLAVGLPVIIYVDASNRTPGLPQHFVLVTGFDEAKNPPPAIVAGDNLLIHDPWHGDVENLCPRYGKTIATALWGIILFSFAPAPPHGSHRERSHSHTRGP